MDKGLTKTGIDLPTLVRYAIKAGLIELEQ
jgi:hypothetical protein